MIFVSKPDQPEPPTGPYLGHLTDELGGDDITTIFSGGPKNYTCRTNTNKVETKVCGITLIARLSTNNSGCTDQKH